MNTPTHKETMQCFAHCPNKTKHSHLQKTKTNKLFHMLQTQSKIPFSCQSLFFVNFFFYRRKQFYFDFSFYFDFEKQKKNFNSSILCTLITSHRRYRRPYCAASKISHHSFECGFFALNQSTRRRPMHFVHYFASSV